MVVEAMENEVVEQMEERVWKEALAAAVEVIMQAVPISIINTSQVKHDFLVHWNGYRIVQNNKYQGK